MEKKALLFITTASLAANPRLVKEMVFMKLYYNCWVLCFEHDDWTASPSKELVEENPEVQFFSIHRKKVWLPSVLSKLFHKGAILLNPIFKKSLLVAAYASNDKTPQLLWKAKQLSKRINFEVVIAHNLGAFYPAVKLAELHGNALQLDIEDFYPGEALYFNKSRERQNRMQIMAHSFLMADTITYASEGIALECQKQFYIGSNTQQSTILNAFASKDFKEPAVKNQEPLKCVWFSQHIGPNRGLEQVFEAAMNLQHIEFHFIGKRNQNYLEGYDLTSNIIFHDSMRQEDLHQFLSHMDIGLALENAEADHNRNICLTNKILAYAQAGLYILATDTFGQRQFFTSLDYKAGTILSSTLQVALQNLAMSDLQQTAKLDRWQKAKIFSWDKEQLKLKELVK